MPHQPPVSLSRPFEEQDAAHVDAAPPGRSRALMLAALVVVLAVVAVVLALRWLDDTSARDKVQVLQPLPQSDASKTATTSAVAYPFGDERNPGPEAAQAAGREARVPPARAAAQAQTPARVTVPPGIAAEQWHAIVAELSTKPDGAREIANLETQYRFADTVRQFRELERASAGDPSPALKALAQQIDAELDAHVAQRRIPGSEAYDIKAIVLEVLEPDPDEADRKLERWSRALPRAGPAR